jgi:hypothetical protein
MRLDSTPIASVTSNQQDAPPGELNNAMTQFLSAAATGQCHAICTSWHQLRSAAKGMRLGQILQLAEPKASAARLGELLLGAHAQLGCYMCKSGIVTCETCSGRGVNEDGRKCTGCDGRGLAPCGFCRGTGWADMDLIPQELRQPVVQRRYQQVKSDLKRLGELCAKIDPASLARMAAPARQAFAKTLLHVHSRCVQLADEALLDGEHRTRMQQAAGKIEQVLDNAKPNQGEQP